MKKICTYLILITSILNSYANTYYVSTSSGNDAHSLVQAQNPATPWKSLAKLNTAIHNFKRGDVILFKRNDTFYGSLTITGSVTSGAFLSFGTYGLGKPPEISGLKDIDQWKKVGKNLWKANCSDIKTVNNLLINGEPRPVGRHPNHDSSNKGYLNINAHTGNFKINTNQIINDYNWIGAEVVVRSKRWILDRSFVKTQSNNTFQFDDSLTYEPDNNFGFFIQNNLNTLDQQHEWYFDKNTHELFLYSFDAPSTLHIQVSVTEILFSFTNADNIIIKDLTFNGAAKAAIEINGGSHFNLTNLSVINSGMNAINAYYSNHIDITQCKINRAYNNGISLYYSNNVTIAHNEVNNISTVAGMGLGGDMQYLAINVSGSNNIIANNIIDSVGYIGIYFDGDHITVENNRISNFCLVKDDGGGIYSFSKAPFHTNRTIRNNIITNGIGSAEGTPYSTPFASGIYLDDNASNIMIKNNTISQCSHSGIYIRNSSNTIITRNLIFDNAIQLKFIDDLAKNTSPIKQTSVYDNTIISRHYNQPLLDFNLSAGSIKAIGTFQHNRYIIPSNDSLQIRIESRKESRINRKLLTPLQWRNEYRKDSLSTFTILPFYPVYIQSIESGNLITSRTTAEKTEWLNAWSSHGNINLTSMTADGRVSEITFKKPIGKTADGIGAVFTQQFKLERNRQYAFHFTIQSSLPGKNVYIKIREDKNSTHVALEDFVIANNLNTSYWKFFTAKVNYDSARIYFEVSEDAESTKLGNIELYEIRYNAQDVLDVLNIHTNSSDSSVAFSRSQQPEDSLFNNAILPPYSSVVDWKNLQQIDRAICRQVIQAIQVQAVNPLQNNFTIVFICVMVFILILALLKKKYWQYMTLALIIFISIMMYFLNDEIKVINTERIVLDINGIKISKQQYLWPQIKQVTFLTGDSNSLRIDVDKPYSANDNNYIILQIKNGEVIKKRFATKNISEVTKINQIVNLLSFYKCPIKRGKS